MGKKAQNKKADIEYTEILKNLLRQVKNGSIALILQDNKVIQINVTEREPEVRRKDGDFFIYGLDS